MAAVAAAVAGACGDDISPPDAGSALNALVVLEPPGESIGLAFHAEATLRVRYTDPSGLALPGAPVSFQLVTSASEATGGATVSASAAATDAGGVASVALVAGAERVNFRVQATAAGAAPALFYIAVSEGGFTDLRAMPEHAGFRAAAAFGPVDVRLYRAAELRCASLDLDAPPDSVFPPRALDGFGGQVDFKNVSAGEPYTLIAWAVAEVDGARLAGGCVELGASQVRSGGATRLPLPVVDRLPAIPDRIEVDSTFDVTPLADLAAAAGPDAWAALDCPLGRAQLLIDCALDAQAPDGALDCAVNGAAPLVDEVQARRGPLRDGCRPAEAGGGASIDAALEERLGAPWPDGALLEALLAARRAPLRSFRLSSVLAPGSSGGAALAHRLERLAVSSGDATAEVDLVASDRPVVRQVVPVAIDLPGGRLSLAAHRFTLDYGAFARAAFVQLGLEPADLGDRAGALGSALYQSVARARESGCPAFSAVVCGAAGRAVDCLVVACGAASARLDLLLDDWWRLLDGPGSDLVLSGSAPLRDSDADLVLDGLGVGSGDARGAWAAEFIPATGEPVAISGSFTGAPTSR